MAGKPKNSVMARLATENFVRGVLHHVRHQHVYEMPNCGILRQIKMYYFKNRSFECFECMACRHGAMQACTPCIHAGHAAMAHACMDPCRHAARAAMRYLLALVYRTTYILAHASGIWNHPYELTIQFILGRGFVNRVYILLFSISSVINTKRLIWYRYPQTRLPEMRCGT